MPFTALQHVAKVHDKPDIAGRSYRTSHAVYGIATKWR